ncbi:TolB-like translocation protein [Pelolinea submarina]|uniref:WD40 repeat protein n=1 Tax=Pelolinea submarina TaxID=913107 RepID=A0A347ZVH9_9CHLR|nr:PD40 domain-containing protein [Pelolinea submarina]REG07007.1 WD40 repeat protein [Pelolinea submarina]BBB49310.1 TolB protein [Pelolinea submarina]
MKKFDRTVLFVILASAVLLAVVIIFGSLLPVRVSLDQPQEQPISPLGGIAFTFSRPVNSTEASALWQTDPQIPGWWQWQDERHAIWHANTPLSVGENITLTFLSGTAGKNGERIKEAQSWTLTVRQPRILTLKYIQEDGQELFSLGLEENSPLQQITNSDGRILNYAASPNGEQIIFSARNDNFGADLWIVNRDGSEQHMLLECGSDRCGAAAWSPVSREVAYTREAAGLTPEGAKGAPRIWMLNLDSLETAPLFEDDQKIGYGPKWSPNGQWLSIWDGASGGVTLVNRKSGETFLLESSSGDTGCWSPDSKSLYYANLIIGESSFHNVVLRADIEKSTIETVLGGNLEGEGMSYDNPECHPLQNVVAASIQPNTKIPGKLLTIYNMDTQEETPVMNDMTKFGSHYSWNPGGEYFLFQMSIVSHKEEDYEIWVRDIAGGQNRLLLSGGRTPSWLP